MAQPGAVIDVVMPKALTDELLEQVGLFVRALGRTEPGNPRPTVVTQARQAAGGNLQRLFPGGFAEMRAPVLRVDVQSLAGCVVAADQRLGQAMRMGDIVEPEAALHAKAILVGRSLDALDPRDLVDAVLVADLEAELAANPAIGTDALDLTVVGARVALLRLVEGGRRHQRACRASLDALAAGNAGRLAHGIAHVEDDL